ncbi:GNAT family N-acetyltransferase [Muricoccus pecuniae]|uniref:GNAT family N-acetyltransferase n=1 Tax=Muricoccus pecuniae TaxID=693023 RepID=UPI0035E46346
MSRLAPEPATDSRSYQSPWRPCAVLSMFAKVFMISPGSSAPLKQRRIGRAATDILFSIPLDTDVTARFLGPLEVVAAAVRRGAAHVLVMAERDGEPLGFYVTHPDPQDGSTWWLGYLAVSSRAQGAGIGRAMVTAVLRRLSGVPGCRRVLLLVDRENRVALRLYRRMGFAPSGTRSVGTEEILAWSCAGLTPVPAMVPERQSPFTKWRRLRVRSNPGPHAARVIGLTRGPPALISQRRQRSFMSGPGSACAPLRRMAAPIEATPQVCSSSGL